MDIYEQYKEIESYEDFVVFLRLLEKSLKEKPNDWDNKTLFQAISLVLNPGWMQSTPTNMKNII